MKAIVAALAVAGALGVMFLVMGPRDNREDQGGSDDTLLAELVRSQARTADALERLEVALERLRSAPEPAAERTAVPTGESSGEAVPPQSLDELIASLDALRLTIEAESHRTQELIRSAPAFGGETLQDVRRRVSAPDWAALGDLEQSWRDDAEAADRSQYFQTARDLLQTYGPPTAIYRPKGGVLFYYRQHEEGMPGPAWYFRLQDGMVIEFFLEDEKAEGEAAN